MLYLQQQVEQCEKNTLAKDTDFFTVSEAGSAALEITNKHLHVVPSVYELMHSKLEEQNTTEVRESSLKQRSDTGPLCVCVVWGGGGTQHHNGCVCLFLLIIATDRLQLPYCGDFSNS